MIRMRSPATAMPEAERTEMDAVWIPLVISVSLFAALGNTLLKIGASRRDGDDPVALGNFHRTLLRPAVIGGILAYSVSQLLWITELRVVDLSLAYPLQVGINFLLISGVAWSYLKEPMAWGKIAGIVLIFAGIVLMASA